MRKHRDITAKRFGRLTAVERRGNDKHGFILWLWKCDCGTLIERVFEPIRQGRVVSCGCYKAEQSRLRAKHGQWKTRTYRAWIEMKARAGGKDASSQKHYLNRGIKVHSEWHADFLAFWRDMGDCPLGMTLERKNNDGSYEPGNCRWATQAQQTRNTRRTVRVEIGGEEMCLKDACAKLGVNYECVRSRIRLGKSPRAALNLGA